MKYLKKLKISSKDTISCNDIKNYIVKNIEKFPEESRFTVLCGLHHNSKWL